MKQLKFDGKKKMTLLERFEKIVKFSQEKGLSQKVLDRANPHIEIASKILEISPMQTVLFAHFLNKSGGDADVGLKDIADSIHCDKIQLLQYMNDIDELEDKRFIRRYQPRHQRTMYNVPIDVIKAIRNGIEFKPIRHKKISIGEFFDSSWDIIKDRIEGNLSFDLLIRELKFLIYDNNHLSIVKKLKCYGFDDIELVILMYFFVLFLSDYDATPFYSIRRLLDRSTFDIDRQFKSGQHRLMKDFNLIENADSYGLADTDSFKLTDKAKLEFLE
jgi:hypothetical protein